MCYHGPKNVVQEVVKGIPKQTNIDLLNAERPAAGNVDRVFKQASLTYFLPPVGEITYKVEGETVIDVSNNYAGERGAGRFITDLKSGYLKEIDSPIQPVTVASEAPAQVDTRPNRLAAAEEDTGFKLGAKVESYEEDLSNAVVVGFARIDENGNSGVRKVVVQETTTTTTLFDPSDIFTL